MLDFEWDKQKASSNVMKHGVSFDEAKTVFYDENAVQFFDAKNSGGTEDRFLLLGVSNKLRILIVCHCERNHGKSIRIISARKATKTESAYYEGRKL